MICAHCGALLVEDRFMDWSARWRCLKCGCVQDSVSVENYLARHKEDRLPPADWDEEARLGSESFGRPDVPAQCLPRGGEQRSQQPSRAIKRLLLLTLLTLSSVPAYGAWVEVSVNVETGQTVYVDPDTIRRTGDIAQMWALYDNKTPQTTVGDAYLSRKVQNEYDCAQEMRRMVSVTEFSGNMASGKVVHMNSSLFSTSRWMPAQSGLGGTLLKVACSKK